ncbi:MAG: hypothetical protein GY771_00845, partial [bacterium]|nr:hypothetical protein [bacterium]
MADRGNNRIVKLHQLNDHTVVWDAVYNFEPREEDFRYLGGTGILGLEDIETDDTDFLRNGVFVLDSKLNRVVQLDPDLTEIIQEHSDFRYEGHLYNIDLTRGYLGTLMPYTSKTGMELYEVQSSIENMTADPNPFVVPDQVTEVTLTVTS